jgi:hypothetical protein
MPTTLPTRQVSPSDRSTFNHVLGSAAALVLAAVLTVLVLDRSGLSYAADGQSLITLSSSARHSSP